MKKADIEIISRIIEHKIIEALIGHDAMKAAIKNMEETKTTSKPEFRYANVYHDGNIESNFPLPLTHEAKQAIIDFINNDSFGKITIIKTA